MWWWLWLLLLLLMMMMIMMIKYQEPREDDSGILMPLTEWGHQSLTAMAVVQPAGSLPQLLEDLKASDTIRGECGDAVLRPFTLARPETETEHARYV
jgi:hypothetical protein